MIVLLYRVIILPQIILIPHTPSLTFTFTILKVNLVIDDSCYTYETESSISKCDYEARLNIAENDLNSDLRTQHLPLFSTTKFSLQMETTIWYTLVDMRLLPVILQSSTLPSLAFWNVMM